MESDPIQPKRLHATSVRDELHRNSSGTDPRQLPYPSHLFLRSTVFGGGATAGVQVVPARYETGRARAASTASDDVNTNAIPGMLYTEVTGGVGPMNHSESLMHSDDVEV